MAITDRIDGLHFGTVAEYKTARQEACDNLTKMVPSEYHNALNRFFDNGFDEKNPEGIALLDYFGNAGKETQMAVDYFFEIEMHPFDEFVKELNKKPAEQKPQRGLLSKLLFGGND